MGKNYKRIIALVKKEINALVAKDNLGEAADLLQELAEICDHELADEVTVLKRGISDLNQEQRSGKISFKEASEIKNQLADRLLGIAKALSQYASREIAY